MLELRKCQEEAVARTLEYWRRAGGLDDADDSGRRGVSSKRKFLWNAKPRFGKTIAAYNFAERIGAKRILIITNRPAISDAWQKDFAKYFGEKSEYIFSNSREKLMRDAEALTRPLVFFISLQDLKGRAKNDCISEIIQSADDGRGARGSDERVAREFKEKNRWIFELKTRWDLLIIDEGHEGIKTSKTTKVLEKIPTKFTLYLSGTPFRAVADKDFREEQIFNYTYLDEQETEGCGMPQFRFRLMPEVGATESVTAVSPMRGLGARGDVNTKDLLDELEKVFREFEGGFDLRHSFWLMSGVAECRAMKKLLAAHQYFAQFEVVLAAGKTENYLPRKKILDSVRKAIGVEPEKTRTITLSCGQLAAGVTVPEWTAVLMLNNTNDIARMSVTQYLQAAFRAQNPREGKKFAYIFDFLPERAVAALKEYAEKLCTDVSGDDAGSLSGDEGRDDGVKNEIAERGEDANYGAGDKAFTRLLGCLKIEQRKDGRWRELLAKEAEDLAKGAVAREVVDGGFVRSDKLFDFMRALESSEEAKRVLAALGKPARKQSAANPHREIKNLAAVEEVLGAEFMDGGATEKFFEEGEAAEGLSAEFSMEFSAGEQAAISEAMTRMREDGRKSAHKKYYDALNDLRERLRRAAQAIPVLLYIYGEGDFEAGRVEKRGRAFGCGRAKSFEEILRKVPEEEFESIAGMRKADFLVLYDEGIFRRDVLELAMREFARRDGMQKLETLPRKVSEEILTPPSLARKMVEAIYQQRPELFRDPEVTFFDPAAKSGVFLAMIAEKLFREQRAKFRDDEECMRSIAQQIYACSANKVLRKFAMRTMEMMIAGRKFGSGRSGGRGLKDGREDNRGMMRKENYFIYTVKEGGMKMPRKLRGMHFDIVIGNPPYQFGRRQVYADFYKLAVGLDPELICMVFPQGWQKPYNHNGLRQLNTAEYKRDPHLVQIDNYDEVSAEKFFSGLGTGGVNIVLRDKKFDNGGHIARLTNGEPDGEIFLPITPEETPKPKELLALLPLVEYLPKIDTLGSARKPYGFYADPLRNPARYHLELQDERKKEDDVRLFGLLPDTTRGFRYIARASLPRISPNVDSYKLFVPKAWGNMAEAAGLGGSYANICVARPGDVCSETFIEFGPFAKRADAIKMGKYFMTKFFRALLFLAKDSQNTAKDKYRYVPLLDFSEEIWQRPVAEIDEYLLEKFAVPAETRKMIIGGIQERGEVNIEVL